MTIGEKLKRARKKLNHELDDAARNTKIAKMFLIAIENDDFSKLPGGVYTRNFIRTYARFLNLDEDIITAEYHEQHAVKPHFVLQQEQAKKDDLVFKHYRRRLFSITFIVVLILALLVWAVVPRVPQIRQWWQVRSETVPSQNRPNPLSADDTKPDPSEILLVDEPLYSGELGLEEASAAESIPYGGERLVPAAGVPAPASATGESLAETDSSPDPADQASVVEGLPMLSLPRENLDAVQLVNGQTGDLSQVFALEAIEDVRIQVTIDGVVISNRLLKKAEVRFYKYGYLNSLLVEDGSKLALQDGDSFRRPMSTRNDPIHLIDFGSGGLMRRLLLMETSPR